MTLEDRIEDIISKRGFVLRWMGTEWEVSQLRVNRKRGLNDEEIYCTCGSLCIVNDRISDAELIDLLNDKMAIWSRRGLLAGHPAVMEETETVEY